MPNIEILERKRNPLLAREELVARITFDGGTPSRVDIRKMLADELGEDQQKIFVRKVTQEYGLTEASATVMIYDTLEDASELEPKHVVARHELKGGDSVGET